MEHFERSNQITTILNIIGSGGDAEACAELETYISELEANQPVSPARIVAILNGLESHYSIDISTTLRAYISKLEIGQQLVLLCDRTMPEKDTKAPVWSHQRSIERKQQRRERVLRKQNNYR